MTDMLDRPAPAAINDTAKNGNSADEVLDRVKDRLARAIEAGSVFVDNAIETVKARPVASAAVGVGILAALARATRARRKRPRPA